MKQHAPTLDKNAQTKQETHYSHHYLVEMYMLKKWPRQPELEAAIMSTL
jgi:hypothetical protein